MRILFSIVIAYVCLVTAAVASPCYQTDPNGDQYFCGGGTISIPSTAQFFVNAAETLTIAINAIGPIQGFDFDANTSILPDSAFKLTSFQSGDFGLTATYVGSFTTSGEYLVLPFFFRDRYGNSVCVGGDNGPGCSAITYNVLEQVLTTAIPEPSTWAMLLIGFTGVGFMAFRRTDKRIGLVPDEYVYPAKPHFRPS